MTVLLALLSAVAYGASDFAGGVLAARISSWTAGVLASLSAAAAIGVVAVVQGGEWSLLALGWGALGGVCGGFGVCFLYRGLATGRMGVVAPLSGVLAAVTGAVAGVVLGDRPSLLAWVGIALALPATWLVAHESGGKDAGRSGVLDGLLAGLGFGFGFVTVARIPHHSGVWPIAVDELVAGIVLMLIAILTRNSWVPRTWRASSGALVPGILGGAALVLYQVATHHGLLSVTTVVSSLYPAFTVALAVLVLREHVAKWQTVGLLASAVSVVLVSLG